MGCWPCFWIVASWPCSLYISCHWAWHTHSCEVHQWRAGLPVPFYLCRWDLISEWLPHGWSWTYIPALAVQGQAFTPSPHVALDKAEYLRSWLVVSLHADFSENGMWYSWKVILWWLIIYIKWEMTITLLTSYIFTSNDTVFTRFW